MTGKIIMFNSGYFWINKKCKKIKDIDPSYPAEKYADRKYDAPIVVSNHVK